MSSTPADLDGLSRLMALIISESETDAKGKNLENGNIQFILIYFRADLTA
jgi:hypothetical protein